MSLIYIMLFFKDNKTKLLMKLFQAMKLRNMGNMSFKELKNILSMLLCISKKFVFGILMPKIMNLQNQKFVQLEKMFCRFFLFFSNFD